MSTTITNFAVNMSTIFASASKLVFLMIAITVCIGFFMNKLTQDNFMYIATSVFSYYFGVAVGGMPGALTPPAYPMDQPTAPAPVVPVMPIVTSVK